MNFLTGSPIFQLFNGRITILEFFQSLLYILPALVIAVSFHEAAHAWMANRMGDPTARNLGRVTLDPTKHFDIWGIMMFVFVGFGWGKPVPTNPRNYNNYKKGNILVAISGVVTNLLLSFVFFGITYLIYGSEYILYSAFLIDTNNVILKILSNIVTLNIILCFFNLIPIPPLDGHHLIKGFIARLSPNFYMTFQRYGYYILFAILLFTDVIQIALFHVLNWITYVYRLFFGLFV